MLTAEQSRATRARLGLSQRRTAEQAAVPRSYLNQFERGRWIPTDVFLAKLLAFYADQGPIDPANPELWAADPSEPDPVAWDPPDDDLLVDQSGSARAEPEPDAESESGWRTVVKGLLAVGVVGGLLVASGNLPAALEALRRIPGGRRPSSV